MQEFRHVLETRGRYQLVAVSYEPVYAPGDVVGHAVVADDGDRLTDLVSLAEARQLLLQRVREEGEEPGLENENNLRKKASRWRRRWAVAPSCASWRIRVLPSKKYLLIAIVTLATLLLGFVFSGYLTLLFLGLDTKLFTWNTYYQYYHAIGQPQVAPFVGKIKWAGYVGFGLPLLVLLVTGLVLLLKKDKRSLHGDARFATGADLSRHGMFKKTGQSIVVGSHGGKLVRLDGQQFVILAAPTRSGKGVGVVIEPAGIRRIAGGAGHQAGELRPDQRLARQPGPGDLPVQSLRRGSAHAPLEPAQLCLR